LARSLNLGILAHVDAGKTTLTERLLYNAGVIDEVGRVDDGNTQADTLELERQRGITIKSAVVSFAIDDVTVNLIDTPGHPDFIAEVERVLGVLDGAVLVVSAVEGVQAQTRVLMHALQRLNVPTLIFVNKIDRTGADVSKVISAMAGKLSPSVIAMGEAREQGTRRAAVTSFNDDDAEFTAALADTLTRQSDDLLGAYLDDRLSVRRLRRDLARQSKGGSVHPVFAGSAATGAGVAELTRGIKELLPAMQGDPHAAASGKVFKVERGPAGEKVAYVRMFSGTIEARDRVKINGNGEGKVTGVSVFDRGKHERRVSVASGQIGKLWGLDDVRIGDTVGQAPADEPNRAHFAPPTLETVVVPVCPSEKGALQSALSHLSEQDPLIDLRQDDARQELSVSLYGEVQKEIIESTLLTDYGVRAVFRESTTICLERPVGSGAAHEIGDTETNPFLATVGFRIDPAPVDSGVEFRLEVELGSMPFAFFRAVEDTVREALNQGMHGWRVTDCVVTMTHAGYWPRQSHAHQSFDKSMSSTGGDFRNITPLVLMDALRRAGTRVYEPMHRFTLEIPDDVFKPVASALGKLGAVPESPELRGDIYVVDGIVPAAQVHTLQQRLPSLSRGEGVLETAFDHYQEVRGAVPSRPRTDHNPLDRKEYLLHVQRRV
jgi:ribosomal protection tetracycline resistance protein